MMKIALLSPPQRWSIFQIFKDLKQIFEENSHEVDLIMNRRITPKLTKYDKIITHFLYTQEYENKLFQEELNEKTYIWAAGPGFNRIQDWTQFEHIIAQSKFEMEHLPSQGNIEVCPAGINTEIFHPYKVDKNIFIGSCGNRNQKRKRADLVDAVCKPYSYEWHDGWNNEFWSQEDLAKWYSSLERFVFLSTFEGGGMPLLEAGACGIPVITTPVGHGLDVESFVNVNIDDSIEDIRKAIESNEKNPRREIVKKFSWDNCKNKWFDLLGI